MRTHTLIVVLNICSLSVVGSVSAEVYRWHDSNGQLHFSNRAERAPEGAVAVELDGVPVEARGSLGATPLVPPPPRRVPSDLDSCREADVSGVTAAMLASIDPETDETLTLLVGGDAVRYARDTVFFAGAAADDPVNASLAAGAVAFPSGGGCPSRPPLPRYAVAPNGTGDSSGLCDDFQQAFAQVGVAVSRDDSVARSFAVVAADFAAAADQDGRFGPDGSGVTLPPWLVTAHAAQSAELAAETGEFVDELVVALEEIDAAARAIGCW